MDAFSLVLLRNQSITSPELADMISAEPCREDLSTGTWQFRITDTADRLPSAYVKQLQHGKLLSEKTD